MESTQLDSGLELATGFRLKSSFCLKKMLRNEIAWISAVPTCGWQNFTSFHKKFAHEEVADL